MKKILINLILLTAISHTTPQYAVSSIKNASRFYKWIGKKKNDLAIVFFYTKGPKSDKIARQNYENDEDTFEDVEDAQQYVEFAKVDLGRDDNSELKTTYNITSTPTFILFDNGEKIASISPQAGRAKFSEISSFIRTYFRDEIEEEIKEEQRIKQIEREELARRRAYYYYYPYYHYPYYYRPYYRYRRYHRHRYPRGYFGIGFGSYH